MCVFYSYLGVRPGQVDVHSPVLPMGCVRSLQAKKISSEINGHRWGKIIMGGLDTKAVYKTVVKP